MSRFHKSVAYIALAGSLFAAGCTTNLSSTKVAAKTEADPAPLGQVYYLPRVEHLVTLERELVKCDVQVPARDWAPLWLEDELINFANLQERLDTAAAVGRHPNCAGDDAVLKGAFDTAYPLVKKLLPTKEPGPCGATANPNYQAAYKSVSVALLKALLADPVLAKEEVWAKCDADALNVDTITETTDIAARLKALGKCQKLLEKPGQANQPVDIDLKVAMAAVIQEQNLPDMQQVYAIQYTDMADRFKKTEYTIGKYPNGTLKNVNATIEDRTAEVIQSTLRGALKLAAASGGFVPTFATAAINASALPRLPLTFEVWKDQHFPPLCKANVRLLLQQKAAIEGSAEEAAASILALVQTTKEATNAAVMKSADASKLQKELDALPADDKGREALAKKIEGLKAEAKAFTEKAEKATKDKASIEKAQGEVLGKYSDLRKRLTRSSTQLFTAEKGATEVEVADASEAKDDWFDQTVLANYCTDATKSKKPLPCDSANIPTTLKAWVASYLPTGGGDYKQALLAKGLVYREPAHGLLMVCRETQCIAGGKPVVAPKNIVYISPADFPQLGVLAVLPLQNKPFQNNTLAADFSPSGSLEKLYYKSNARAERAAQAFENSASDILAFADAQRGAKKKELETQKGEVEAETALLTAEADREKARKALEELTKPAPTAKEE